MTHLYLIDNTLPCDLPDLYEGIEDNEPDGFDRIISVAVFWAWAALWITLGLVAGVMI